MDVYIYLQKKKLFLYWSNLWASQCCKNCAY